jgi:hypothetical protein
VPVRLRVLALAVEPEVGRERVDEGALVRRHGPEPDAFFFRIRGEDAELALLRRRPDGESRYSLRVVSE